MISSRDYAAYLARHGSQEQRPRKPRGSGRVGAAKLLACEVARDGAATKGDGWVELVVPVRTPNPNNGTHGHWRTSAAVRRRIRFATAMMLHGLVPPTPPCVVTLTRCGRGKLDAHDGLRAALKPVCDAVAGWLKVDDGDEKAVEWRYGPQVRQAKWGVKIRVETKGAVTG